jgi:hypothetical protein
MTSKRTAEETFTRLHNTFHKWSEDIGDISKALEAFVPYFQESREGWILAGRTIDGKKFAPLSSPYKERKLKKWGPKPILVASGRMLGAVKGGPGWKHKVTAKELQIELDYAQLLQLIEGGIEKSTDARINKGLSDMAGGAR